MASEESFVVLVHHRGSIKRKTRSGVKFTDKDPLCIVVKPTTSYDDLVRSVLMKLGLEGAKRVKKFFYRIPITVLQDTVKYDCFTIGSDEDLQVMFLCRRQFPEVRTPELLAKLVDVVSSSGGDVVGSVDILPNALQGVPPVGVGDGVLGDVEEDDVEPDMIEDDSGDEVGATEPALAVGGSSSGTQ
ncbi:Putative mutator sub-class protein [Arachis hypogaea]|nr:Putative mutator sub-class protein [Arachis hypogaea]